MIAPGRTNRSPDKKKNTEGKGGKAPPKKTAEEIAAEELEKLKEFSVNDSMFSTDGPKIPPKKSSVKQVCKCFIF